MSSLFKRSEKKPDLFTELEYDSPQLKSACIVMFKKIEFNQHDRDDFVVIHNKKEYKLSLVPTYDEEKVGFLERMTDDEAIIYLDAESTGLNLLVTKLMLVPIDSAKKGKMTVHFNDNGREIGPTLCPFDAIFKAQEVHINKNMLSKAEYSYLKGNFHNIESIKMTPAVPPGCADFLLVSSNTLIVNGFIVKVQDLDFPKCSKIEIDNTKVFTEDVNLFLRAWENGCFPAMKSMIIKPVINNGDVFRRIRTYDWTIFHHNRIFKMDGHEPIDCANEKDIKNVLGQFATVIYNQTNRELRILVWKNRLPRFRSSNQRSTLEYH